LPAVVTGHLIFLALVLPEQDFIRPSWTGNVLFSVSDGAVLLTSLSFNMSLKKTVTRPIGLHVHGVLL